MNTELWFKFFEMKAPVTIKSDLSIIWKYIWNLSFKIPASQPLQSLIKNSNVILAQLRCVYFWQRDCTWTCLACRKFKEKAELWTISTPPISTYIITHGITTILMNTNTPTHPLPCRSFLSRARGEVRPGLSHRGGVRRRVVLCKTVSPGTMNWDLPSSRSHPQLGNILSAQRGSTERRDWYDIKCFVKLINKMWLHATWKRELIRPRWSTFCLAVVVNFPTVLAMIGDVICSKICDSEELHM